MPKEYPQRPARWTPGPRLPTRQPMRFYRVGEIDWERLGISLAWDTMIAAIEEHWGPYRRAKAQEKKGAALRGEGEAPQGGEKKRANA